MIYLNTISGDRRDQEDVIVRVTQAEFRVMAMFFHASDNSSLTPEIVAGIRSVGIARKMLQDALAALEVPGAG